MYSHAVSRDYTPGSYGFAPSARLVKSEACVMPSVAKKRDNVSPEEWRPFPDRESVAPSPKVSNFYGVVKRSMSVSPVVEMAPLEEDEQLPSLLQNKVQEENEGENEKERKHKKERCQEEEQHPERPVKMQNTTTGCMEDGPDFLPEAVRENPSSSKSSINRLFVQIYFIIY